jgi:hypothetical protein
MGDVTANNGGAGRICCGICQTLPPQAVLAALTEVVVVDILYGCYSSIVWLLI